MDFILGLQLWTASQLQSLRTRLARRLHYTRECSTTGSQLCPTTGALRPTTTDHLNTTAAQRAPTGHLQLQRLQTTRQPDHPTTGHARATHFTTVRQILHPSAIFENYCLLTAGQDDATTINLFYNTATAEPATPFLPLHSLPGKLHEPANNRLQMLHPAADAHLWHYYGLTHQPNQRRHPRYNLTSTFNNYSKTTRWTILSVTTSVTQLQFEATAPFA